MKERTKILLEAAERVLLTGEGGDWMYEFSCHAVRFGCGPFAEYKERAEARHFYESTVIAVPEGELFDFIYGLDENGIRHTLPSTKTQERRSLLLCMAAAISETEE